MIKNILNLCTNTIERNILLNFASQIIPLIIAFLTIPILIKGLGIERFGVFTLLLTIFTYFNFLDFGLNFGLTHFLADKIENLPNKREACQIIWSALMLLIVLSLIFSIIFFLACPLLLNLLKIKSFLQRETSIVLYLATFSLPLIVFSSGLRSILQAYQRFDLISALQIPLGIMYYLGPTLILFTPFKTLDYLVVTFILIQTISVLCLCYFVNRLIPDLRIYFSISLKTAKKLLQFGGWVTISNVIGSIMVYFDRFLIGALISMSAVKLKKPRAHSTLLSLTAICSAVQALLRLTNWSSFPL